MRRGTAATTAPIVASSFSAGMTTVSVQPSRRSADRGPCAARDMSLSPVNEFDAANLVEAIDPGLVEAGSAEDDVLAAVPRVEAVVAGPAAEDVAPLAAVDPIV